MLFNYKAIDQTGAEQKGSIDALTIDIAISSLQSRGYIISSINPAEKKSLLEKDIFKSFKKVSNKDIVVLSRQIATLFEAQVSALKVFRLLGAESDNPILRDVLGEIGNELQGGSSISNALSKHSKVFSPFYVNMVKAGEESGRLDETFIFLADYLDRTYEVNSKAKNALIYPAFVVATFVTVMILMLTLVIPKVSAILIDAGQEIPFYTRIVLAISNFFVNYGLFFAVAVVIGGFFLARYVRTEKGSLSFDRVKLSIPYLGNLYSKLYLSRISDNMNTMLASGIPMVRVIETSADIVDNKVFEYLLKDASEAIRAGSSVADAFDDHPDIPNIMVQMVRIGEETGQLGSILKTLANFYRREVNNAVDTLVGLIEPVMIVLLGLGVGILLASVLIPIYNISAAI